MLTTMLSSTAHTLSEVMVEYADRPEPETADLGGRLEDLVAQFTEDAVMEGDRWLFARRVAKAEAWAPGGWYDGNRKAAEKPG